MKEIKKYTDIIRYGKSRTEDVLNKGDIISITEKIDGANASFRIDNTISSDTYSSFSISYILNNQNLFIASFLYLTLCCTNHSPK